MEITQEQLDGLRKLRLHHWKGVVKFDGFMIKLSADIEKLNTGRASDMAALKRKTGLLESAKKIHSFQLSQVQFLNQFFTIGDTAEKDASK